VVVKFFNIKGGRVVGTAMLLLGALLLPFAGIRYYQVLGGWGGRGGRERKEANIKLLNFESINHIMNCEF